MKKQIFIIKILLITSLILSIITLTMLVALLHKTQYDSRDVNHDGEINAVDYVIIRNYIMENE